MTSIELLLIPLVFVAYAVGTALGFGSSILMVTFGALFLPLDLLLPVVVPLNLGMLVYLARRHRTSIDWGLLLRRVMPWAGLGVPVGIALFQFREHGPLRLVFGVFVILLAALQLRGSPPAALPQRWGNAMLFGGGLVHGLFGTGGPLLVYVLGREVDDKATLRSTMSAMWIVLNGALAITYVTAGLVTIDTAMRVAVAAPVVAVAVAVGELAHGRLDPNRFKRGVWSLLLAGGIVLAARALFA